MLFMPNILLLNISGGTAISGLGTTAPVGVEDVMCPSNAISAYECNATSPPMTSRCLGTFNAAGVRCTRGMYIQEF